MTHQPDNTQELDEILEQAYLDGASETMWQNERHVEIFATAKKELLGIIRTEKLKLLAEVRERVVGEGELVDAEILKKLYDKAYSNGYNDKSYENSYNSQDYRSAEDIAPIIAKIRGGYDKRLANLTKLEAEL